MTVKRWYRSRRNQFLVFLLVMMCVFYYIAMHDDTQREPDLDITRRVSIIEYIENRLQEALKEDKGTGCEIPKLDPFAKEVSQFDKELPKVICEGTDWVKCYLSECRVVNEILDTTKNIECTYRDILYESDSKYTIGPPTVVRGRDVYRLTKSDHVKVKCTGTHVDDILPSKWTGHTLGYRSTVTPQTPPPGREDSYNVLILGFDSTSKNGFIRRMPKSYKVLTEELRATVLNRYNIVGDGTPAALFPILTGKTELELPEARKSIRGSGHLDAMPFIFYKLKKDGFVSTIQNMLSQRFPSGDENFNIVFLEMTRVWDDTFMHNTIQIKVKAIYRTAYFEDMPWVGTFQYRFNGFRRQPADHYLRAFYLEESTGGKKWWKGGASKYCVGDTPQYKLMLNITDQFLRLDGKRFIFTFIADITHDDFNMIATSDDDVAAFLMDFKAQGRLRDTLLLVMGDHGPRYANVRDTFQGKLEERLPLMALVLPDDLKRERPDVQTSLESNMEVLTTPHDIHATILDVIDFTQYWSSYKVAGADLKRGVTLLEPVPRNRSCSEAGIEPHWCACLKWNNVSQEDPLYEKTAHAFVAHLNGITESERSQCALRTLTSIQWVMRQQANSRMLSFEGAKDVDGYVGKFGHRKLHQAKENYQLKIIVGPGRGIYEASMIYLKHDDKFLIDTREISRTNAYGTEPSCISATKPHLNMYCYCNA